MPPHPFSTTFPAPPPPPPLTTLVRRNVVSADLTPSLSHGANGLQYDVGAFLEVKTTNPAHQGHLGVHLKAQLLLQCCLALSLACSPSNMPFIYKPMYFTLHVPLGFETVC